MPGLGRLLRRGSRKKPPFMRKLKQRLLHFKLKVKGKRQNKNDQPDYAA